MESLCSHKPSLPHEIEMMILHMASNDEDGRLNGSLTLVCKSWTRTVLKKHAASLHSDLDTIESYVRDLCEFVTVRTSDYTAHCLLVLLKHKKTLLGASVCYFVGRLLDKKFQPPISWLSNTRKGTLALIDVPLQVFERSSYERKGVWMSFDCTLDVTNNSLRSHTTPKTLYVTKGLRIAFCRRFAEEPYGHQLVLVARRGHFDTMRARIDKMGKMFTVTET